MLQGLIDTKKESIEFLQDTFSAPISERIYEICLQCQKLGLREFQKELCSISKWNNFTIEEETNKIIAKSGCDFLPKMLKIVILSSLKIKFYEYSRKVNTLKIKIPSSSDFLHKCLINVSEFAWKHSYLFAQKNMKAVEIQNNMNEIEHNVRNIIAKTVSEYLNVKYVVDKLNHLIEKHIQNKTKKKHSRASRESEIIEKHIDKSDFDNNNNDGQERKNERVDFDERVDERVDEDDERVDERVDEDDERVDERVDEGVDEDDKIFENHFNNTTTEIEEEAKEKYNSNDRMDNQEESDEDLSQKDDSEVDEVNKVDEVNEVDKVDKVDEDDEVNKVDENDEVNKVDEDDEVDEVDEVEQQELRKEENDISKFKSDSDSSEGSDSSESDSDLESEPNPNIKIVKINDLSKRKFF